MFLGLDSSNYKVYNINGRKIVTVSTNWFRYITENDLFEAALKYPNFFGVKSTEKVIEALFKIRPYLSITEFKNFLNFEQFLYAFEINDGKVVGNTLRLDLFRIDNNDEFTGGIFHALKHFTYMSYSLTTKKGEINLELKNCNSIIIKILDAFFIIKHNECENHNNTFISLINLNEKRQMKFVFYYQRNNDVYFLKTCLKTSIKN